MRTHYYYKSVKGGKVQVQQVKPEAVCGFERDTSFEIKEAYKKSGGKILKYVSAKKKPAAKKPAAAKKPTTKKPTKKPTTKKSASPQKKGANPQLITVTAYRKMPFGDFNKDVTYVQKWVDRIQQAADARVVDIEAVASGSSAGAPTSFGPWKAHTAKMKDHAKAGEWNRNATRHGIKNPENYVARMSWHHGNVGENPHTKVVKTRKSTKKQLDTLKLVSDRTKYSDIFGEEAPDDDP
jgi:hypothetical protein